MREYAKRHRLQVPNYHRIRYLKKYGLTLKEYERMAKKQKGLCAICFGKSVRALAVDHHHKTGQVRGLLCGSCNAALGLAKENVDVLSRCIDYLEKYKRIFEEKRAAILRERKLKRIQKRNDRIIKAAKYMREHPLPPLRRPPPVPDDYVLVRHVGVIDPREFMSPGLDKCALAN
jgi:transcription elongation factor Elf1